MTKTKYKKQLHFNFCLVLSLESLLKRKDHRKSTDEGSKTHFDALGETDVEGLGLLLCLSAQGPPIKHCVPRG